MSNIKIKAKSDLYNRVVKSGRSRSRLAKEASLSLSHISSVMRGKYSISPEKAKKICEILNCEFDDIFELIGG